MKVRDRDTIFERNNKPGWHLNPFVRMKTNGNRQKNVRASNVSKVLYRARGVWPFDFAPDEVIVEEKRLIVINNWFPFGSDIGTLPMNRISSIEVFHSLIFSSLVIQNTEFHGFHCTVKWLTNKDAQSIKEIVDGIKVSELSKADLPFEQVSAMRKTFRTLGHI